MAQEKAGAVAPTKTMTAAEMQQWIEDHDKALKNYAAALDPLKQLRDITKSSVRRVESLTKERIVTFLKDPTRNEANIRNASWYLFFRSQLYQRIIMYFSTLFCLDARSVIPKYDLVKPDSDEKILKSYNDTLKMLGAWNIKNEFLKVIITCMVQDVSYNIAYYDETGLYFFPLPPDYCRIYAQYPSGDFAFALDISYFRKYESFIDIWGEPFTSMWRKYQADMANERWQVVPPEYSACFKYHAHDWQSIIPPFSGLLGDLINLNDIADVQNVADKMEIYKLVYMKLRTLTNAKMADEWAVSPAIAIEYGNRIIEEALPDYASFGIVPGNEDLGVVDFSTSDKTAEQNKVLKATKSVLNTSGGAQILNSAEITGSTAFHAALHADENYAMSSLLPQIQGWTNRILPYTVKNPSKVHYFFVGTMTRDEYRKELLESAQYSLPTKLAIMSLSGIDALDTLSLNHLEEDILKLGDRFNDPLKSSYTASAKSDGGRPTSSDSEITDDGDASRDKADRAG